MLANELSKGRIGNHFFHDRCQTCRDSDIFPAPMAPNARAEGPSRRGEPPWQFESMQQTFIHCNVTRDRDIYCDVTRGLCHMSQPGLSLTA